MTVVLFKLKALDGSPVAFTRFKVEAGYPDTVAGLVSIVIPAAQTFTTDVNGEAQASLKATNVPYFVSKIDEDVDEVVSYKFFVPESATPIEATMLYVDLSYHLKLNNDKSIFTLIETKVAALQAVNVAKILQTAALSALDAGHVAGAVTDTKLAAVAATAVVLAQSQAALSLVVPVSGATPPANPTSGLKWLRTDGKEFTWLVSGGAGQWVETNAMIVIESPAAYAALNAKLASADGAASIGFKPVGTLSSTNTQSAVAEVSGDVTALQSVVAGVSGDLLGVSSAVTKNKADLAAISGAKLVGFGASTVAASITRNIDFFGGSAGASAAVNDAAFADAMTYLATVGGGTLIVSGGDYATSQPIASAASNIHINLKRNAGIVYGANNMTAVNLTGVGCSVTGGKGRGFIGPAIWDGANTSPAYGVITIAGNFGYVSTRLQNVRKLGVWFKDVFDGSAEGNIIEANYPTGQWTGVETGHWGIMFDPAAGATAGNFKALGNTIKGCVQGVMASNYGVGGVIQGLVVTGNIIEGCWNHGVYTNFTNGAVITGNGFNRCQIPVVVSGNKNVVTGNSIYTAVNTVGDERDSAGISVRDGSGNIISGNTIKGVFGTGAAACISIQDVNGTSQLNDNIVTGNTIDMTAGIGVAIRILGNSNAINRNIVSDNTIKGLGKQYEGAISVYGIAGALNLGNKIHDNTILLFGESNGIYHTNLTAADIHHNTVEWAYDSAGASVVTVASYNSTNCTTDANTSVVRPAFGANLTVYGYREFAPAANNTARNSVSEVSVAKGASYAPFVIVSNSGLTIDQTGVGIPNFHARIGSRWFRSDGGVGATFYVKEAGTDASGWTAK